MADMLNQGKGVDPDGPLPASPGLQQQQHPLAHKHRIGVAMAGGDLGEPKGDLELLGGGPRALAMAGHLLSRMNSGGVMQADQEHIMRLMSQDPLFRSDGM
jgi:hypothetical protein